MSDNDVLLIHKNSEVKNLQTKIYLATIKNENLLVSKRYQFDNLLSDLRPLGLNDHFCIER